jgi:sigma-B regulation protein RsbU (phosphoserine phosphatase)
MPQAPPDRLSLLYNVSQAFNSSLDLDEVLNRVMDEVIALTRAERGFVVLRGADGQLIFRAARGVDQTTIDAPDFQVSRGVIERVVSEGQARLTSDAQTDAWLGGRESVRNLRLRAILCVPLPLKGAVLGAIYVDSRLHTGIFTQSDVELLNAVAASAAIAIENARLYLVAVEKGRLERELQLASEVQAGLLPRETPRLAGWDFAGHWQPVREVAGDYYDFIRFDDPGRLGLVIADVTDKGMPAALFMALTRSTLRASAANAPSVVEAALRANRLVCADAAGGTFVTLFYGEVNQANGEVTYVNAGHNAPLWYRADQDQFVKLARTGMPLGVEAGSRYEQRTVRLDPGDCAVLFTDGVTDAINAQTEEFGDERLRQVIRAHHAAPAADIIAALVRALEAFTGTTVPFDDVTLVVAKRL